MLQTQVFIFFLHFENNTIFLCAARADVSKIIFFFALRALFNKCVECNVISFPFYFLSIVFDFLSLSFLLSSANFQLLGGHLFLFSRALLTNFWMGMGVYFYFLTSNFWWVVCFFFLTNFCQKSFLFF